MINVVFLGGEDVSARIDIAQLLKEKGCEVSIIGSEDEAIFKQNNIPYQKIEINREFNIIDDIKTILRIRKILKQLTDTTIVHAFDTKLIIYLPFATIGLKNIKKVRTINGMGRIFSGSGFKYTLLQQIYVLLQRMIKNRVDFTIFQNTDNYRYFLKNNIVNPNSAKVIKGSGINLEKFHSEVALEVKQKLIQDLGIDTKFPTAILVSRLIKQKGITEFLHAAKNINSPEKRMNFLLVGQIDTNKDAVSRSEIDSYADYVNYLGRRNDVRDLLSISDVFVLPTYYSEGVPRVLMEAAAMKLALISTDMPGCNDVVVDDYNGKIIEIRNSNDLTEKLNQVISDTVQLEKYKANSFAHVQQFSLENVTSDCFNIYKNLIFN